jgi:TPR repeat protein
MLRAWYSPRAKGGMTPFEMLPILADHLVAASKDKRDAARKRDAFLARTVEQMETFAAGAGDVPDILKRCGKVTEGGLRLGRMEMSYFLGVAYELGTTVAKDAARATRWLQAAGNLGSRSALARLGAGAG